MCVGSRYLYIIYYTSTADLILWNSSNTMAKKSSNITKFSKIYSMNMMHVSIRYILSNTT